jgi:hypothetical protein
MVPGILYTVTKESDDGTLNIGDRIRMDPDGALRCFFTPDGYWLKKTAAGMLPAEEAKEALKGVENPYWQYS